MVSVLSLLIPIALSAVLVFIASSIIHMATPWHKNDLMTLPDEEGVMKALRPFNLPPGNYGFPRPGSMADMKSPAFLEKIKAGPVGFMTIRAGWNFNMGGTLFQWFLYSLVVSLFAGYIAGVAFGPGTEYLRIMQVAGCVAFVGLRDGANARVDLVGPAVELDHPQHARRTALRTAHRRDIRVAVAEMTEYLLFFDVLHASRSPFVDRPAGGEHVRAGDDARHGAAADQGPAGDDQRIHLPDASERSEGDARHVQHLRHDARAGRSDGDRRLRADASPTEPRAVKAGQKTKFRIAVRHPAHRRARSREFAEVHDQAVPLLHRQPRHDAVLPRASGAREGRLVHDRARDPGARVSTCCSATSCRSAADRR